MIDATEPHQTTALKQEMYVRACPKDANVDVLSSIMFEAIDGVDQSHGLPHDITLDDARHSITSLIEQLGTVCVGYIAETEQGKIVGSAFVNCIDGVAYVGPVTVHPTYQGYGVGRKLMQALMDHDSVSHHTSVCLTQEAHNISSFSLYASFGFIHRDTTLRLTGKLLSPYRMEGIEIRPMGPEDIEQCFKLQEACNGTSRRHGIAEAAAAGDGQVAYDQRTGDILGFVTSADVLGYYVARGEGVMKCLIGGYFGRQILVYCSQRLYPNLFKWLREEHRFKVDRISNTMVKGFYRDPVDPYVYLPSLAG
mmetsp:Transcript_33449/g.54253  ORF Transcript_33449/g.54253 Transcript_33449/m.54253 type:complete len:309 (-) Transcript_33449:112-1038(-)|eukprot:CAMPEP_0184333246 /NCGR_PEP_ID=MMETSP1089-20130417/2261_1 /TAXON_ID=38269 ORGANISM="Gloeochaete wittrockiana, Strain SAG46.84" /NCGR_SAMPLE_ID=MMETSP1089 /ASSEMBLY_ACC=CAM_ASM_000445 /LENGTH=308 /DNA_ID=CAMNT_0026656967 /DNA_START=255 /DNA_END=1181 /DNA_ORIENTATION=+